MRDSYDFTEAQRNPYAKRVKKQVTIRIDEPTLEYFRDLSSELGIPFYESFHRAGDHLFYASTHE